jgi:hypothetical protein
MIKLKITLLTEKMYVSDDGVHWFHVKGDGCEWFRKWYTTENYNTDP